MAKTKIVVDKDEFYGWHAIDIPASKARGNEIVVDVDDKTAKRYRKATREFTKMMNELEELMGER